MEALADARDDAEEPGEEVDEGCVEGTGLVGAIASALLFPLSHGAELANRFWGWIRIEIIPQKPCFLLAALNGRPLVVMTHEQCVA